MDIPNHPAEKYFRIIPVRLWVIVLLWFVAKCFLAANTELGNDEVYYWTYAQKLQWSYFDHPPVIAVLIKLFTLNLSLDTAFVLRFGAICCGAISTFLIYQIGSLLKDEETGYMSALLFIASPYS